VLRAPLATRDIAAADKSVDPNGHLVNDGEEGFEGVWGRCGDFTYKRVAHAQAD
jgi:hypothetical protein